MPQNGCCFIMKILQHTNPWMQSLMCLTVALKWWITLFIFLIRQSHLCAEALVWFDEAAFQQDMTWIVRNYLLTKFWITVKCDRTPQRSSKVATYKWLILVTLTVNKNLQNPMTWYQMLLQFKSPPFIVLWSLSISAQYLWYDQAKWVGTRKYLFGDRAKQRK